MAIWSKKTGKVNERRQSVTFGSQKGGKRHKRAGFERIWVETRKIFFICGVFCWWIWNEHGIWWDVEDPSKLQCSNLTCRSLLILRLSLSPRSLCLFCSCFDVDTQLHIQYVENVAWVWIQRTTSKWRMRIERKRKRVWEITGRESFPSLVQVMRNSQVGSCKRRDWQHKCSWLTLLVVALLVHI